MVNTAVFPPTPCEWVMGGYGYFQWVFHPHAQSDCLNSVVLLVCISHLLCLFLIVSNSWVLNFNARQSESSQKQKSKAILLSCMDHLMLSKEALTWCFTPSNLFQVSANWDSANQEAFPKNLDSNYWNLKWPDRLVVSKRKIFMTQLSKNCFSGAKEIQ